MSATQSASPPIPITPLTTIQLFPPSYTDNSPIKTPLSILDANVVNFTTSAAIWYLNPSTSLSPDHFCTSLTKTLSSFPQWCGRLSTSPYEPGLQLPQNRCGRVHLRYHDAADPGVSFTTATYAGPLSSLISSPEQRAEGRVWDKTAIASSMFMSKTRLAAPIHDAPDVSFPGMAVQVTRFECGGWAVAVGLTHCLADAHALLLFVKHWAFQSRSMLSSSRVLDDIIAKQPTPTQAMPETPLFNPSLLDSRAPNDVSALTTNPTTYALAKTLSMHRHDQWASRHGAPFKINIPAQLASNPSAVDIPVGRLLDWKAWNLSKACRYCILHFPAAAVEALDEGVKAVGASKLDALTAHVWACIVRAREACGVAALGEEQTAYVTLGMRDERRLGLGEGFIGSPLLHAAVPFPPTSSTSISTDKSRSKVTNAALSIRKALGTFTPQAISAYLSVLAHDTTPQRVWHAFCGSKSLLVTSWVRAGLYEADFVGDGGGGDGGSDCGNGDEGGSVRFAEAVMPVLDGLMQVSEAVRRGRSVGASMTEEGLGRKTWYADGVDVTVMLEEECMRRLLEDPGLFG